MDIEMAIKYAQLAVHTLSRSATEITPKSLEAEMKMFYEKFSPEDITRLVNSILKKGDKRK